MYVLELLKVCTLYFTKNQLTDHYGIINICQQSCLHTFWCSHMGVGTNET